MKKTLMDEHSDIVDREEELEPDFTWRLYRTNLIEETMHFQGSISIEHFRKILERLEEDGYSDIYFKLPVDIT